MRINLKHLLLSTIFIANSFVLVAENISAHEHAERTHNNIILLLQTKNVLFEEDSDLFIQEISNAFSPIVDFKTVSYTHLRAHET